MAKIDVFFKAMNDHRATEFYLASESEPQFKTASGIQAVSKQKFSNQEVMGLLSEIMSPAEREKLMDQPKVEFTYKGPVGEYHGTVSMEGHSIKAVFLPAGAAAPHQEAPAAAPAASAPAPTPATSVSGSYKPAEIDKLLHLLVERKGSDLHLSAAERPCVRIDGDIKKLEEYPVMSPDDTRRILLEIAGPRYRQQYEEHHDTDFAYEIPGLARFRVNYFSDRKGMGGVLRVIPSKTVTVEDLKLSLAIQNLCYLSKGLVLVTGPTGSGKSTTLCALVDLINRTRSDHIITLEDPIEFVHENKKCLVNQREIGSHTDSFKNALRAALREDPDIVLVGEMRDLETISIAIETAETGHLVFGTLHTSTAASTVDRVIEQFPPDRQEQIRVMMSESLKGIVAQTLCKKIGGGRVAAMEVLFGIPAVSNLIREGKTYQLPSIIQTNRKMGMVMLNDALMEIVKKKIVEPKDAYIKSMDKIDLLNQLKRDGFDTSFVDEVR
ncbi:TPA: type IV pili twitching motility protein PilT [Candidatus Edwardsbacteria bacterium]|nr:type IV pili twitching motility protein PilT [Candidatus Edwardsbacteria bacterium]HBZ87127.1 type IV pili twitching motility protein PilT [Candidatus Edwardsbacteria bacterium]